jgi:hypothetical protein
VWEYLAFAVPEHDVAQFEGLRTAWAFGHDDFAGPCSEEESGDEQVDGVVKRAGFGGPLGAEAV